MDWLRASLDWLRPRRDSLGSGLDWLRSSLDRLRSSGDRLDSLGSGLDRLGPLWDLLRLSRDDPLRDLGGLGLNRGGDSLRLRRRNSAASGWLDGEGVVIDWSLDWCGERPGTPLTEWLEHKESVGGWAGGSGGWGWSGSYWSRSGSWSRSSSWSRSRSSW